jgi:hypothetical protein
MFIATSFSKTLQQPLESALTPAIGVMQEFGVGLSSDERHAKCLLG